VVVLIALVGAGLGEMANASNQVVALIAMATFLMVLRSGPILRFLSLPVSQWLGRLSFPLYLIQISIIVSLTSGLIVFFGANGILTPLTALGIALVSVVACLIAAQLFMPVERFTLDLASRVGRIAIPAARTPASPTQPSTTSRA
jgi:peptidoglycan/LPS O-acetylase OafA/YrhL